MPSLTTMRFVDSLQIEKAMMEVIYWQKFKNLSLCAGGKTFVYAHRHLFDEGIFCITGTKCLCVFKKMNDNTVIVQ